MSPLLKLKMWTDLARTYRNVSAFRWLLLGILIGIISGILAVAFFAAVEYGKFIFLNQLAGLALPAPEGEELFHGVPGILRTWTIPICTTIVGLTTGWLVNKYIPETIGAALTALMLLSNVFIRVAGLCALSSHSLKGSHPYSLSLQVVALAVKGQSLRWVPVLDHGLPRSSRCQQGTQNSFACRCGRRTGSNLSSSPWRRTDSYRSYLPRRLRIRSNPSISNIFCSIIFFIHAFLWDRTNIWYSPVCLP